MNRLRQPTREIHGRDLAGVQHDRPTDPPQAPAVRTRSDLGVWRRAAVLALAVSHLPTVAPPAAAQDRNIPLPIDSIEYLLTSAPFDPPTELPGTRFDDDRTKRVDLVFGGVTSIPTQWAPAPAGGEAFNNVPRYELAAYEIAKLLLDDEDLVVPPTALRMVPLDWYRTVTADVDATFSGAGSVLVVLQSFVYAVTDEGPWSEDRFEADPEYARHWANLNLLTYLIRHADSNTGNVLVSTVTSNPRVFAVDNGVAFGSEDSARGTRWASLLVRRFPAGTVQRLRTLTETQLREQLGVLAQWEIRDGELVRAPLADNLDPRRGVRRRDGTVQLGLTRDEIEDLWYRLEVFLGGIDDGVYATF